MTLIRPATTPADLAEVQRLCWDYRTALAATSPIEEELTETFYPIPKYTALMDELPTLHARPKGIILLAEIDGQAVGCGMTHPLDDTTSEIKRVFTDPAHRGKAIAADLCRALMAQARTDGFTRIVLDTSINLTSAQALYAKLGFTKRGPYQDIPEIALPHLVFYEAQL